MNSNQKAKEVFKILEDFHNEHYATVIEDELTSRLVRAYYREFVGTDGAQSLIGRVYSLCNDKEFKAVVVAVKYYAGGAEPLLKLKWRDQRGFTECWMPLSEIRMLEGVD